MQERSSVSCRVAGIEHTSKNKMILAVKRADPAGHLSPGREAVTAQIRGIKEFYGIREQSLEKLLQDDPVAATA